MGTAVGDHLQAAFFVADVAIDWSMSQSFAARIPESFPRTGCPQHVSGSRHVQFRLFHPNPPLLWERDIDDAFWELDNQKHFVGIERAVAVVRMYRKLHGQLWCSIAKAA